MPNDNDDRWVEVSEAAAELSISPSSVKRAADKGRLLAGRTPGGHRRISWKSVQRLKAELAPPQPAAGEQGPGEDDQRRA